MKIDDDLTLVDAPLETDFNKTLAIISHNVKGPIRYMQYITDYALANWDTMKPEALLGCAEVINESSRNIDRLLGNLLSWARIQEGSLSSNAKLEDLNELISNELRLYAPFFKIKSVTYKADLKGVMPIYTDKNLFSIVFQNILSNAIKFAPKHSVIEVAVHKNEVLGEMEVYISDQGKGFDADIVGKLCGPEPIINAGTSEELGTGYGLKLSQHLMSILGGSLSFQSVKGEKTSVGMHLPY